MEGSKQKNNHSPRFPPAHHVVWIFSAVVVHRAGLKLDFVHFSLPVPAFNSLTGPNIPSPLQNFATGKSYTQRKLNCMRWVLALLHLFPFLVPIPKYFLKGLLTLTQTDFNGRNSRYHDRLMGGKFLGRVLGNFSKTLKQRICAVCQVTFGCGGIKKNNNTKTKSSVFLCIASL